MKLSITSLLRTARTSRARTRKSTVLNLEELGPRLLPSGTPIGIVGTSGGGQSIGVNNNFFNALEVTVENLDTGRPVSGVYMTFTAPASGASGTFSNGSTTISGSTDFNGHLTESFTANAVPGGYGVTAKISGTKFATSIGLTNNKGSVQSPAAALTPQEVQAVYGFNSVPKFNNTFAPNGQGQTIAILDPGSDPNVAADLATFSAAFNLPQCDGMNGDPTFTQLNEYGGSQLPAPQPSQIEEIDLDVEWVHAIAPKANIVLVGINSFLTSDVKNGLTAAANRGASVVSMSFLIAYDPELAPPPGVTYVSAAGDAAGNKFGSVIESVNGTPTSTSTFTTGAGSGDLIVGGTQLAGTVNPQNPAYPGEQVWEQSNTPWTVGEANGPQTYAAGTTYGTYHNVLTESNPSLSVPLPSWQAAAAADVGQQTGTTPTDRMVPDVSLVATNLPFADATDFGVSTPWVSGWGTSFATPMWAGLIAIANQGRQVQGLSPLNSTDDPILPAVYNLPSWDFNHVTSDPAAKNFDPNAAYDLATGLGTPRANLIIPALAAPDGQLIINGNNYGISSGSDTITISMAVKSNLGNGINLYVEVQDNNQTQFFLASAVNSIVVNTGAASDTVNINVTPVGVPVTINLGSGTDTVNINGLGPSFDNSGLGGTAWVYGGTGRDTLNVSDQALGSALTTSYFVTDWSIQRSNSNAGGTSNTVNGTSNTVNFEGLSQVTLNGVSPAATGGQVDYNVGSTLSGAAPALMSHPGAATVSVVGSSGGNNFYIGGAQNYFATTQTLSVSTGNSGKNFVFVNTLPKGVALNIGDFGSTDNFVYVGSLSYSLTGIQGAINVSNTSGTTSLVVDGSDDPSANYTLTSNTLSVSNGPTITYQPAAPLTIGGTTANSLVGVTSIEVIEGGAQDCFDAESAPAQTNVFVSNEQTSNPWIYGAAAGSVTVV